MLTCARPIHRTYSTSADPVVLETRVVSGNGGGPDKTILNSPRFLWSAGYKTLCAYMHPPGDTGFRELQQKAEVCQAPLFSVPDRGPWDYRVISQFLKICRRERVAIWHGHDYKSNALGLVLRRFWPMRLMTTVHGWVKHTHRTPVYYKIDEMCLPRYDAVVCVSEDLHARCVRKGVRKDRCWLIENGIDSKEFSRRMDVNAAKRQWNVDPKRLTIGAVGRLSAEKGFDILIRAVHSVLQQGEELELLIAGTGDAKPQLTSLAAELGLTGRVRFLGHVSDPRSLFEALDVFALSSHREGLPNVVLEALAMDVPVVATRVNGVPRLIQHEMNGLLVSPNSVEELAHALLLLVRNPELRDRLALAGRQTIVERYDFGDRMVKIRAIYDALLLRN